MSRGGFWINQAFFQASWPACVIGAAHGLLWPGLVVVGAFLLWQLTGGRMHRLDPLAAAVFAVTGLLLDTLWVQAGIVSYALAWPVPGATPLWLLLLWISLGLTVNHSLSVFRRRWVLFGMLATAGSPLSYSVAAGLSAVDWLAPAWLVVFCVGPVWGLVTALLFRYVGIRHVDRSRQRTAGVGAPG